MTNKCLALLLLSVLIIPVRLVAKSPTSRIVISGADLAVPVEITGAAAAALFVWAGRGTFANGTEGRDGFIVDWRNGSAPAPPSTAPRYEVSFYVTDRPDAPERLAYVVLYADDRAGDRGYVYFPGPDDRRYTLNVRSIHRGRGVEGNWFRATEAWQKLATPLIRNRAGSAPEVHVLQNLNDPAEPTGRT